MQLAIAISVILSVLVLHQVNGHVRLVFPPARQPNYDFLDNVRTGGPCGVPDDLNGKLTTFQSGSTINVSFHLAYAHRGGILINILSQNGTIIHALLGLQWQNSNDSTQFIQEVTLPDGFECDRCALQLLRQAAEWTARGGYTFWSCSDISIVNSPDAACNNMTCSGNGNCVNGKCECDRLYSGDFCQQRSECADNSDCGGHGSCVDLEAVSFPTKMCFCQPGWQGDNCARTSILTDANIDPADYTLTRQLNERLVLHAKIIGNEIEVALKHNGTGYVALGWRPSRGLDGTCRVQAPGAYPVGAHPLWPTGETFPVVVGTGELVYNRLTGPGSVSGGVAEEEGATEEGATEETAVEEGATEETAVEEGATEESAVEEGGAEGGAEEGAPETTAGGSPLHPMDCTDIVIGVAREGEFRVFDYYTRDRSTPRRDSFYGGQDDITAAVGKEEDGITYIKWRKPLVSDDPADHSISTQILSVIWSFGQVYPDYFHFPSSGVEAGTAKNERFYKPDEIKYHGTRNRGATSINFHDVDGDTGSDPCQGGVRLDCANGNGCSYEASWIQRGDMVDFTVKAKQLGSSSTEWVAIGFSDDRMMPMSDVIVGAADDTGFFVTDRYATQYAQPPLDDSQDITNPQASIENGLTTMTFTRPLAATEDTDISLTECRFFLYGWGGSAVIATKMVSYHPQTPIVSSKRVCFLPPTLCPADRPELTTDLVGNTNEATTELTTVLPNLVGNPNGATTVTISLSVLVFAVLATIV